MTNSFFFLQLAKSVKNRKLIGELEAWSLQTKTQVYVIDKPLGDSKYQYDHQDGMVVLIPKHKIMFIDFSDDANSFENYVEDFVEDLGSISDKYRYKEAIGRPREWRRDVILEFSSGGELSVSEILNISRIDDPAKQRICELLISLLTGSINDIERVKADIPDNILDKIKQKIVLFDGDQTRFVYQGNDKKSIRIQGLSGTGKTELLLHKLKELYVEFPDSKILFTCHNKILAESLRRRIPSFFNFMKVEKQIEWENRLWCIHAWGSYSNVNSGAYRYICAMYGLTFNAYSASMSFQQACALAVKELKSLKDIRPAFDFIMIDESQDFPESFFELCSLVVGTTIYIAGDIFQGIFASSVPNSVEPDFLLSKCYRTDPRTLMLAHALGMGLFERQKLNWLEDEQWKACGYILEKNSDQTLYSLTREPLMRFEDIDKATYKSVNIVPVNGEFWVEAAKEIVKIIKTICNDNPTVTPNDIGIILLDNGQSIYTLGDRLEMSIAAEIGWPVNKAYESKRELSKSLFVSNRNNVKGLEFPFVICVTKNISTYLPYRNALYMAMTRSFLQSYLVTSADANQDLLQSVTPGLAGINNDGRIVIVPPTEAEKRNIRTNIKVTAETLSLEDFVFELSEDLEILPIFRKNLLNAIKSIYGDKKYDPTKVRETLKLLHAEMAGAENK